MWTPSLWRRETSSTATRQVHGAVPQQIAAERVLCVAARLLLGPELFVCLLSCRMAACAAGQAPLHLTPHWLHPKSTYEASRSATYAPASRHFSSDPHPPARSRPNPNLVPAGLLRRPAHHDGRAVLAGQRFRHTGGLASAAARLLPLCPALLCYGCVAPPRCTVLALTRHCCPLEEACASAALPSPCAVLGMGPRGRQPAGAAGAGGWVGWPLGGWQATSGMLARFELHTACLPSKLPCTRACTHLYPALPAPHPCPPTCAPSDCGACRHVAPAVPHSSQGGRQAQQERLLQASGPPAGL